MSYQPEFTLPGPISDPLIPKDFSGWFNNVIGVLKRSGLRMAGVMALWSIIPVAGGITANVYVADVATRFDAVIPADSTQPMSQAEMDSVLAALAQLLGIAGVTMAVSAALAYFTSAAWAAMLRIAITDAAGQPISFGQALGYGARRGLVMWGWYLLVLMCALVGLCMCVLPGAYLAVAFALFAPVVVCEGGPAMARSLRLVHRAFGAMLGRIALLAAAVLGVNVVVSQLQSMLSLGLVETRVDVTFANVAVGGLLDYVIEVVTMVGFAAGLLVTYVESRAGEGTLASTTELLERSPH